MDGSKMNKSQSKYYNTACLMDEALIQLLERKSFEYITVKEVCEKAGVNRSTFYLHYETMVDLLNECIAYNGKKLTMHYENEQVIDKDRILTCPVEELLLVTPKYLLPYLNFVKENKNVYMAAVSQPSTLKTQEISKHLYDNFFEPILMRFHIPDSERKYRISFFLNGVAAIITEWVKDGCKDPVENIADIIIKCLHI